MKHAVILVNTGSPRSPSKRDVRSYLHQFLTDERVIDIPWLQRQLLVRGVIVPKRVAESSRAYSAIWKDGSPLIRHGERVATLLQQKLSDTKVVLAMRYGTPSIEEALSQVAKAKELTILPLFPQYASATTGSVHAEVMRLVSKWNQIPKLHLIDSYPTHPMLIQAFAERGRAKKIETFDHILFSFHGLPERHLKKADANCLQAGCCEKNSRCYRSQCLATAKAIATELQLPQEKWSVSFQSRLGNEPWLQPYTSDVVKKLNKKRVLLFCPAFVADCLETLFEIENELKETFLHAGGEHLEMVESLNDHPLWIDTLVDFCQHPL